MHSMHPKVSAMSFKGSDRIKYSGSEIARRVMSIVRRSPEVALKSDTDQQDLMICSTVCS